MTTTAQRPLTQTMREALISFYYVKTYSWTEGNNGDVTYLAEHGGMLKGRPACTASTREALERRELLTSRAADHGRVYQVTDAAIEVLRRELLTADELNAIDAYLVDQARAEDLLRAQHADRPAEQRPWLVNRSIDQLTSELGRQRQPGVPATQRNNWALRRDVFAQLADAWLESHSARLSLADAWDAALTEYFDREGWTAAAQDRVMVERWPAVEERYRTEETATLGALAVGIEDRTLPELIQLYAKVWHRAANQPSNPELVDQLHGLKQAMARQMSGWVPLNELEDWCDR